MTDSTTLIRPGSLAACRTSTRVRAKARPATVSTNVRIRYTTPPKALHVVIFPGVGLKNWRFHAKAANGRIVAQGEGYRRKWSAHRGAARAFPGATITFAPV